MSRGFHSLCSFFMMKVIGLT